MVVITADMNSNEVRQTTFTSDHSPPQIPNFVTTRMFLK